MVRPWKATALGTGAAQGGQKARAFSYCSTLNREASHLEDGQDERLAPSADRLRIPVGIWPHVGTSLEGDLLRAVDGGWHSNAAVRVVVGRVRSSHFSHLEPVANGGLYFLPINSPS